VGADARFEIDLVTLPALAALATLVTPTLPAIPALALLLAWEGMLVQMTLLVR
jgi:hypothetical protein